MEKSKKSPAQEILDKIIDYIIQNRLKPGDKLPCSEKLHDWSYTIPHGTSYNGDYEKPCR